MRRFDPTHYPLARRGSSWRVDTPVEKETVMAVTSSPSALFKDSAHSARIRADAIVPEQKRGRSVMPRS